MGRHAAPTSTTQTDGHAAYAAALAAFVQAVGPWADAQLTAAFTGNDWKAALAARDAAKTGYSQPVDLGDPRRVLRLVRDEYTAFTPRLTRTQTSYAHLALDVANTWAHSVTLESYRARRGIENLADLLVSLAMPETADQLAAILAGLGTASARGGAPRRRAEPLPDDLADAEAEDSEDADGNGPEIDAVESVSAREVAETGDANDTVQYTPASWEARYDVSVLDNLDASYAVKIVEAEILDVVRAEAPILLERLLTIVGHRSGLGRVQEARRDSLRRFVPQTLIRHAPNHDVVVWSDAESPETFTAYRIPPPDSRRPIRAIPYEELRNAMVDLCRARPAGYPPGNLAWLVNAEFGGQRLKGATRDRLQGVIDAAVGEGTLEMHDGLVRAAQREI